MYLRHSILGAAVMYTPVVYEEESEDEAEEYSEEIQKMIDERYKKIRMVV